MQTYFFRCIAADVNTLVDSLIALGILKKEQIDGVDFVSTTDHGDVWDVVGKVYEPTLDTVVVEGISVPLMQAINDGAGNDYLHFNLLTSKNIAAELDTASSKISWFTLVGQTEKATALTNFSNDITPFVLPSVAETREAKLQAAPNNPTRTFAL